jgi:class 3 adenylate cyclase
LARVRQYLLKFWKLRTSQQRSDRVLWWLAIVFLLGLFAARSEPTTYLFAVWSIYNLLFGMVSFGWAVLHPRSLSACTDNALIWSRWITAIGAVAGFVNLQSRGSSSQFSPGVAFLLIVVAAPFIYFSAAMFSLYGGAVMAFYGRQRRNADDLTRSGVAGWWLALALIAIGVFVVDTYGLNDAWFAVLLIGAPTITMITGRIASRFLGAEGTAVRHLITVALARLVFYYNRNGRIRKLDLRGIAISLVVSVIVLEAGGSLIAPAQQSALSSMYRMRLQIVSAIALRTPTPNKVALIKMDATAQADAVAQSSEAAVQATIVRRLTNCGPNTIVLPVPTIDPGAAATGDTSSSAISRTLTDLDELAQAIKEHGHVILVASPEQRRNPRVDKLVRASWKQATFGVDVMGIGLLPTVPLYWNGDPPAPVVALAAEQGQELKVKRIGTDGRYVQVAGKPVAQAVKGRAVLDFRSTPDVDFHKDSVPTYPYELVLHGVTLDVVKGYGATVAEKPEEYFKGKIVVLEPLVQKSVETPVGVMTQYEMLSRVINSLVNGAEIKLMKPGAVVGLTLLIGLLIGSLCAGRDPLQGSWRVALLTTANFVYCVIQYVAFDVWLDPVMPLAAAAAAFLLVTQLTFSLERDERQRNRQLFSRFIAPNFVEELLESPQSKKLALGGDKRLVCVLFADVRNFTGFAESHEPEMVIEIMNIYLTALTDALDIYGGVLDKYTGDGLMAFFEISESNVQADLIRSVQAASAMRDAGIAVAAKLEAQGRQPLQIGLGMHYGEAVVGLVGNEKRQINYTALGHTVVVSARLQTLAEGGDVVISEPIYEHVKDSFVCVPMEPVFVKGISTEQHPYLVTASRATRLTAKSAENKEQYIVNNHVIGS